MAVEKVLELLVHLSLLEHKHHIISYHSGSQIMPFSGSVNPFIGRMLTKQCERSCRVVR